MDGMMQHLPAPQPQHVTALIEALTRGDFDPVDKLQSDAYCWCHVANGHCGNDHQDWRHDFWGTYLAFMDGYEPDMPDVPDELHDALRGDLLDWQLPDTQIDAGGYMVATINVQDRMVADTARSIGLWVLTVLCFVAMVADSQARDIIDGLTLLLAIIGLVLMAGAIEAFRNAHAGWKMLHGGD